MNTVYIPTPKITQHIFIVTKLFTAEPANMAMMTFMIYYVRTWQLVIQITTKLTKSVTYVIDNNHSSS